MAILPKPQSDGPFGLFDLSYDQLPPAGTWPATILDIRDRFGVERKKYLEESTEIVDLTAFLFGFRTPDGRTWKIDTRPMRISGHPKSALYKFLSSLLGRAPDYGWDYLALKGTKCLLTVSHATAEGGGNIYARVDHAVPLPDYGTWNQPAAAPKSAPPPEIPLADDDDGVIPF